MARRKMAPAVENIDEIATVPKEEWPYELPAGWKWVRLGSIIEASKETTDVFDSTQKYIGLENMQKDAGITGCRGATGIRSLKNVFHENCILYGKLRPYLNKHGIADFDGVCSTDILVFNVKDNILSQYVNYYFDTDSFLQYVVENSKGINLPRVSEKVVLDAICPLPPLSVQNSIIKKIEFLYAKLSSAKDLVQNALDSSETRKAAILHKAFTGELTAEWRKEHNISIDSWQNKRFDAFCLLKRGFDLPAKRRISGEYPLVSSSGIIDSHNEPAVNGPGVVTGRSGSIGKVFYIDRDYWPLNTTLYSKDLFGNDAKYIYYYLQTFDFNYYSSSTAVPTLNRNLFASEMINVPSLPEQHEIVCILDSYFSKEVAVQEALNVIEKIAGMKKFILGMAFHGNL